MTFRSGSVSAFSCATPFGKTARNRPDVDFESDSLDAAEVDRSAAPVDFPDLPGLANELPESADATGGLVFGCRVAPPGNPPPETKVAVVNQVIRTIFRR